MIRRLVLGGLLAAFTMIGNVWSGGHESVPGMPPTPPAAAEYSFDESEIVVVLGGSGRTGLNTVKYLMDAGATVRAGTRDPKKAAETHGSEINWIQLDVKDKDSLASAMEGATYVISSIGNNKDAPNVDYGGVASAVDAAKAAGVRHFTLISSAGVTQPDHFLNRVFNNLLMWKFKGEQHLRASGLDYTIIRPYGLQDDLDARSKFTSVLFLQGDNIPNGVVDRKDVAKVALASLKAEGASGKTFELTNYLAFAPDNWDVQFAMMPADDAVTQAEVDAIVVPDRKKAKAD